MINILDLREASLLTELFRIRSKAFLSGGGVAVATPTTEKKVLANSGSSEEAGISCKSSKNWRDILRNFSRG